MGTNYYIQKKTTEQEKEVLKRLNAKLPRIHIGKSSCGWSFSFHSPDPYDMETVVGEKLKIESFEEWKEVFKSFQVEIVDEYGMFLEVSQFEDLVRGKIGDRNHTEYCRASKHRFDREHGFKDCFLDSEGHSFSRGEFC